MMAGLAGDQTHLPQSIFRRRLWRAVSGSIPDVFALLTETIFWQLAPGMGDRYRTLSVSHKFRSDPIDNSDIQIPLLHGRKNQMIWFTLLAYSPNPGKSTSEYVFFKKKWILPIEMSPPTPWKADRWYFPYGVTGIKNALDWPLFGGERGFFCPKTEE